MFFAGCALGFFLCGGLGVWLFRGNLPELTSEELAAAIARWEQQGPKSYDLELQLGGDSPGLFHIEVRNGSVLSAPTRDGVPIKARHTWETWTVPGQFETIERELELAAAPAEQMQTKGNTRLALRAEFDAQYGYPRRYHRIVLGSGPEVYWEVTKFTVK